MKKNATEEPYSGKQRLALTHLRGNARQAAERRRQAALLPALKERGGIFDDAQQESRK
jgi:hypothetical protein